MGEKSTSERQAAIYELAEKEGIDTNDRVQFRDFFMRTKKKIDTIVNNYKDDQGKIDYASAVLDFRESNNLHTNIPLTHLLQIFSLHENEILYQELGIDVDAFMLLPSIKILNNEEIKKRGVVRMNDLEESQNDNKHGYVVELTSNSIDAAIKASDLFNGESIGKFGQGFLQILNQINEPGARVIVSTKKDGYCGYDIDLKKIQTEDGYFLENYISSKKNTKVTSGTSVKLVRQFSLEEQEDIENFLFHKFKTNTRAKILLNGHQVNSLDGYSRMNGEKIDISNTPTVEINMSDDGLEFVDKGVGMSSDDIVSKLLNPNATGKIRKELTNEEILKKVPNETDFLYKRKSLQDDITKVSMTIGGVLIEDFSISTFGNIGEFSLDFAGSSPLKDSRNEIDISRDVVIGLKACIKNIKNDCKEKEEKLGLLEIFGEIYSKLKDRSSNIVDEKFVLGTVLKKSFEGIKQDLNHIGVKVLPGSKELINNIGYPENVFYFPEEFIEFNIEDVPGTSEVSRVNSAVIKGSFTGKKYSFYEIPFTEQSLHDYFILEDNVFINSSLLIGKTVAEIDNIISALNVGINLNTGYQTESQTVDHGRLLTSGETMIEAKKHTTIEGENAKSIGTNVTYSQREKKENAINKQIEFILQELEVFREQYKNKIVFTPSHGAGRLAHSLKILLENEPYEDWHTNKMACIQLNLLTKNSITQGIGFEELDYAGIMSKIIGFLDRKGPNVTLPFHKVLVRLYIDYTKEDTKAFFNTDFYTYIETLIDILDKDQKIGLEMIERFDGEYSGKSGYSIFRDYLNIEKENRESGNEGEELICENTELNESVITLVEYRSVLKKISNILGTKKSDKIKGNEVVSVLEEYGLCFLLNFKMDYDSVTDNIFSGTNNKPLSIFLEAVQNGNWRNFEILNDKYRELFNFYLSPKHALELEKYKKEEVCSSEFNKLFKLHSEDSAFLDNGILSTIFERINNTGGEYYEKSFLNGKYSDVKSVYSFYLESLGYPSHDNRLYDEFEEVFGFYPPSASSNYGNFKEISEMLSSGELTDQKIGRLIKDVKDCYYGKESPLTHIKADSGLLDTFKRFFPENVWTDSSMRIFVVSLHTYFNNERIIIEEVEKNEELESKQFQEESIKELAANMGLTLDEVKEQVLKDNYIGRLDFNNPELKAQFFTWVDNIIPGDVNTYGQVKLFDEHKGMLQDLFSVGGDVNDIQQILEDHRYPNVSEIADAFGRLKKSDVRDDLDVINYDEFVNILFYHTYYDTEDFFVSAYWNNLLTDNLDNHMLNIRNDMKKHFLNTQDESIITTIKERYLRFIPELMHFKFTLDKALLEKKKNSEKDEKKVKKIIDPFTELSKTYPQDIVTFAQFLKSGGEFLEEKESNVGNVLGGGENSMTIDMSDLIGISLSQNDEVNNINKVDDFNGLYNKQKDAGIKYKSNKDLIAGVNISQDEGGMLFYREGTQNAIDAIKKYNRNLAEGEEPLKEEVKWETYSTGNHFVSSVEDPVGMDLSTVIGKLFTPYNTGKESGDTGQFGKGFFTFAPSSKAINIKTSTGNGKVLYINLIPQKVNGVINDFSIKIDEKDEQFQGTIVERVDEASGIKGNLRAMIGTNLLKKYVGNVGSANITYNGTQLNNQNEVNLISESDEVIGKDKNGIESDLGTIKIFQNHDNIPRFTKDGLYISEIKDDLLEDFPEWITKEFLNSKMSIDIPKNIPLLGSRNSLRNRKYYLGLIRPHLYKQIIKFILESYVQRSVYIPDLPQDYLGMESYDLHHTDTILALAEQFNLSGGFNISSDQINYLKDEKVMAEFLVLCNFEHNGEATSLQRIKGELLSHRGISRKQPFGANFSEKLTTAKNLNDSMSEEASRNQHNLDYNSIQESSGITQDEIETFEKFIRSNVGIQHIIKTKFGGNFEISYSKVQGAIADDFSNQSYGMSFCVNASVFKDYVRNFTNPIIFEGLLNTITHEMAHNLEGSDWGTHSDSFLKIQRMLITEYTRNCTIK